WLGLAGADGGALAAIYLECVAAQRLRTAGSIDSGKLERIVLRAERGRGNRHRHERSSASGSRGERSAAPDFPIDARILQRHEVTRKIVRLEPEVERKTVGRRS